MKDAHTPAQSFLPWAGRRKHRPVQCFAPLQRVNIWWGMGDWDRQNGSGFVERGRSKETKQARNRLTWEACVPPGVMVTFSLSLPVALPQPGSVWLCWCLWLLLLPKVLRMPRVWASNVPCWCPRTMSPQWSPCRAACAASRYHGGSGPEMQLEPCLGSWPYGTQSPC